MKYQCALAAAVIATFLGGACNAPDPTSSTPSKQSETEAQRAIRLARAGDASLAIQLAKRFDVPQSVGKPDRKQALSWYQVAADAGDLDALVEVAVRTRDGLGTQVSTEEGTRLLDKAAALGSARGLYIKSLQYGFVYRSSVLLLGNKPDRIAAATDYLDSLGKAADKGYPQALNDLGMVWLLGHKSADGATTIARDPRKGVELLGKAAKSGSVEAQWALAVLYQVGFSPITANPEVSTKWWAHLDKTTNARDQIAIGDLYRENKKSLYREKHNKYRGRSLSFEETNKVAADWYAKAAPSSPAASYKLAVLYSDGTLGWKDAQQKVQHLIAAADKGYIPAMVDLAVAHVTGEGVAKDYATAFRLLSEAADMEASQLEAASAIRARHALGLFYEHGWGQEKDIVAAYAWYNIAAAQGHEESKVAVTRVEPLLTSDQLRDAQSRSTSWKPGLGTPGRSTDVAQLPASSSAAKPMGYGSGFVVGAERLVVTNNHVVSACLDIRIPAQGLSAKVVVTDAANDLALLRATGIEASPSEFSDEAPAQGEEVFVFGYPLEGYLPSAGNITSGIVSALAGPGNNSTIIQITAPVQPGNSGAPLLDSRGRVIGVVVGKADAVRIAQLTGDVPQNINFAIAPSTVRAFLDGNHVQYSHRSNLFSMRKTSKDVAAGAMRSVVKIECWR